MFSFVISVFEVKNPHFWILVKQESTYKDKQGMTIYTPGIENSFQDPTKITTIIPGIFTVIWVNSG